MPGDPWAPCPTPVGHARRPLRTMPISTGARPGAAANDANRLARELGRRYSGQAMDINSMRIGSVAGNLEAIDWAWGGSQGWGSSGPGCFAARQCRICRAQPGRGSNEVVAGQAFTEIIGAKTKSRRTRLLHRTRARSKRPRRFHGRCSRERLELTEGRR